MKIGIPTLENNGEESKVAEHFGRANFYHIYDSKSEELDNVECEEHEEGSCLPVQLLEKEGVDVIYAFGMGRRALRMLEEKGIEAKTGNYSTVGEVVENLSSLRDLSSSCR
ncbi:MAG: NifB/NifX family molybdenum-iron cluster-binding protein [Candidatus Aenigmatarchaeota archaeon]